jgi:hypothetical protein
MVTPPFLYLNNNVKAIFFQAMQKKYKKNVDKNVTQRYYIGVDRNVTKR